MKKSLIFKSLAIIGLLFFVYGCECSVSTARLTDAKVCTSLVGNLCDQNKTIIDPASPVIYASCVLKNAPQNTQVKFTWLYYGDTKFEIDNVILSSGDNVGNIEMNSSLSKPNNGWPKGVYEVEIRIVNTTSEPIVKQFNIK